MRDLLAANVKDLFDFVRKGYGSSLFVELSYDAMRDMPIFEAFEEYLNEECSKAMAILAAAVMQVRAVHAKGHIEAALPEAWLFDVQVLLDDDEANKSLVTRFGPEYSKHSKMSGMSVRLAKLPEISIRQLKPAIIGKLVAVKVGGTPPSMHACNALFDFMGTSVGQHSWRCNMQGTVVRMSPMRPKILSMAFVCAKCGTPQTSHFEDGKVRGGTACSLPFEVPTPTVQIYAACMFVSMSCSHHTPK